MPNKPKRPCLKTGCNELVSDGYCDKHRPIQKYDKYRGTAAERGYDSRWRKAREGYLLHHPLCVECMKEDIVEPATVVDHRIPHKGNKQLFWDKKNWQSLCKRCHDKKTASGR